MTEVYSGEPGIAGVMPTASAEMLLELGVMYCTGHDVAKDYVAAHKWFNLAALKGRPVRLRFELRDADVFALRFAE